MKQRTKILVVDDDPVALEVTRTRLVRAGYDVVTRETAIGTSVVVTQENPDIVLLDVTMPGISGEALAKLLTGGPKRQNFSIVFHSNRDQVELDQLAQQCRALGSIQKTSSASIFQLQFERLIMRHRQSVATQSRTDGARPAPRVGEAPEPGGRKR
jgi:CheY-like chemotaxis protein